MRQWILNSIFHLSQAIHHPDSLVLLWVFLCFLCICWFPITLYKVFPCDFILSWLTRSKTILYSTASWIGWPIRGLHTMSFYCRYHKRNQSNILPEYNYRTSWCRYMWRSAFVSFRKFTQRHKLLPVNKNNKNTDCTTYPLWSPEFIPDC